MINDSRQWKKVAAFSKGIVNKPELKTLLDIEEILFAPKNNADVGYVVGWGRKPNTQQAKEYADRNKLDYYFLEDGFIHSMGQGVLGAKSCSLVMDSQGMYYDATQPSDIEELILDCSQQQLMTDVTRAKDAIQRIISSNISKYNNAPLLLDDSIFNKEKVVLVIDQTAGDMSLEFGYADESTFAEMIQAALDEHPNSQIIVKTHPDVIIGKKKGNIDLSSLSKFGSRVSMISESTNPIFLLRKVDVVYVATSQMGFEALMLGKRVICFGVPFYAGWGLTDDRADKSLSVWGRRKKKHTLEEVFSAAYINYTRYLHPDTEKQCELEDIITYFEMQYKNKPELQSKIFGMNFTRWKQSHIKEFLGFSSTDKTEIIFVSSANQAIKKGFNKSSQLVTWASKDQTEADKLVKEFGITPWQVEDGFIRSAGLGTDLTAPASLVLDKIGIYYDPHKACDLEILLQNKEFSKGEMERADALKYSLLENELSKYNLGNTFDRSLLRANSNQKIILIPGQVEGDASIVKGSISIDTNTALIKAVREGSPDDYLIYKPHPDVVSGNRRGKVATKIIQQYTDLELLDTCITDCLAVVDEVHTMTSLVGFEGLMRDLKVVCYGLPFYSNWGLTVDRHKIERRTRKLKINELVAGTLIDYPLYINYKTGFFTTPEIIIDQLKREIDSQGGKQSNQVLWLIRFSRKVKNYLKGRLI